MAVTESATEALLTGLAAAEAGTVMTGGWLGTTATARLVAALLSPALSLRLLLEVPAA